jgi:tetratricopeptide (TPR) repeat protein
VTQAPFEAARIDELDRAGRFWVPIRKRFGIGAFGVNAWVAQAEGDEIVSEHVEQSGHEELYAVVTGHARFTVGGEEVDGPSGTLVFVGDPETKRKAVAQEAGTTILSVGAKPGEAFEVSPWEASAEMFPLYEAGDYEGAASVLREALQHEEDPGLLFNLACIESLLGRRDDAVEHLRRSIELESRFAEAARGDSDLEAIRDDPRLTALLA